MEAMMEQFKDLQIIPFDEITEATNTFHQDNYLGGGGFGMVYKGELSRFKERGMVAFKRLDRQYGQGEPEFLKEISTLSKYKHENLITLLGYCMEGKELILVYEYASNGSLESRLDSPHLTWTLRLKICLQAAEGLRYLHDPNGAHYVVIHRDIKSGNILLDEKWNAKLADVGLSKISPENAKVFTVVRGTPGYMDPEYNKTYTLTDKSDVYSFGVTLFEVLCGSLCYDVTGENKVRVFVRKWMKIYEQNKIEEIIFKEPSIEKLDQRSLKLFSDIAYKCLNKSGKERPTMAEVVSKLKDALQTQEDYDIILKHLLGKKYMGIARAAVSLVKYRSIEELTECLSKGVLINGGKTWVSLNDEEESWVLISIEEFLIQDDPNISYSDKIVSDKNTIFPIDYYSVYVMNFKLCVRTPLLLSPGVTYRLNILLQYTNILIDKKKQPYIGVRYNFQGETKISVLRVENRKGYKMLVVGLYQFTSTEECISNFEILMEDCGLWSFFNYFVYGIEFQPLKNVEHSIMVGAHKEIVTAVASSLFPGFTKEQEVLFSQGVLLNKGRRLLCLNEKGEPIERIFISACVIIESYETSKTVHSRFPGGSCHMYRNKFKAHVRGRYLTPHISYTVNLVFEYLSESDLNSHNPLRYRINGEDEAKVLVIYPFTHMREDRCFIVPLYQFTSQHTTADLQFEFENRWITLIVAGFEFQPSEEKEKVELQVIEEYRGITKAASQSLFYTSLDELKQILSTGVHLNGYKTWFSLNEKGEHCHMISMKDCLIPNEDFTPKYQSRGGSRFPAGLYQTNNKGFKTHVKTQLLSPSVTYTVNLVFYCHSDKQAYIDLKYRLRGDKTTYTVYLANQRECDRLYIAELYQFTSDGSIVDLEIIFENLRPNIGANEVEGILFQPLEIVEDPLLKDGMVENIHAISDSGILKLSNSTAKKAIKKIIYLTLRKCFRFNNQEWSYLDKYEKKCLMLSARVACNTRKGHSTWGFLPESRFGEVLVITAGYKFELEIVIEPEELSADTIYATYFVYKLPSDQFKFTFPLRVNHWMYFYLASPPNTPVFGKKFDENSYNPLNRHKLSNLPRERSDGWMEVKVWEFQTKTTPERVPIYLELLQLVKKDLIGLMIYGIEQRPI